MAYHRTAEARKNIKASWTPERRAAQSLKKQELAKDPAVKAKRVAAGKASAALRVLGDRPKHKRRNGTIEELPRLTWANLLGIAADELVGAA